MLSSQWNNAREWEANAYLGNIGVHAGIFDRHLYEEQDADVEPL
jgi:hypothetical protein